MIYRIPGTYFRKQHLPIEDAWHNHFNNPGPHMNFQEFIQKETGVNRVIGNFEDGWIVEFVDEAHYTWFLLKWAK